MTFFQFLAKLQDRKYRRLLGSESSTWATTVGRGFMKSSVFWLQDVFSKKRSSIPSVCWRQIWRVAGRESVPPSFWKVPSPKVPRTSNGSQKYLLYAVAQVLSKLSQGPLGPVTFVPCACSYAGQDLCCKHQAAHGVPLEEVICHLTGWRRNGRVLSTRRTLAICKGSQHMGSQHPSPTEKIGKNR